MGQIIDILDAAIFMLPVAIAAAYALLLATRFVRQAQVGVLAVNPR